MSIGQWKLEYSAANGHPGADFAFGSYESGLGFTAMPVLDSSDTRSDDSDMPRSDVTVFGQDFRGGRTVTFQMEAMTEGPDLETREQVVTDLVDQMMAVWDGDAVAKTGGAVATLRSHTNRVAFGRPRTPVADMARSFQGRATVTAEFRTVNNLWYGPQQTQSVGLVPAYTGGMQVPLVLPMVLEAGESSTSEFIDVGGVVATPLWATIKGPIINPIIELVGQWRFGFETTLAYDETILVDTRPWRPRILRNGSSAIATDAQSTPLLRSAVPPGRYELVLRGTAPTGLPSANVAWRDAHKHW